MVGKECHYTHENIDDLISGVLNCDHVPPKVRKQCPVHSDCMKRAAQLLAQLRFTQIIDASPYKDN